MTLSEAQRAGLRKVVGLRSKRKMTREKLIIHRIRLETLREEMMAQHRRAEIVDSNRIIALLVQTDNQ